MTILPKRDRAASGLPCFVNLIGERAISSMIPLQRLLADFEVHHFSPHEIVHQTLSEREQMMEGTIATLVDWDTMTPVVLLSLKEVARQRAVPLVVMCGPDQDEHVAALVVGGDDVLTHPVNPIMLQARLRAYKRLVDARQRATATSGDGLPRPEVLDVSPVVADDHDVCTAGPLLLDRTARRFYINGHLEVLPAKTFEVLEYLMAQIGVCHSRDDMLNALWGLDFDTQTNILDRQIYQLRSRLKAYGLDSMIETVRGVGYRLCLPQ